MSIQYIKEATGLAKPKVEYNFPIFYYPNTEYYDKFKEDLMNVQERYQTLVNNSNIGNNSNSNKKKLHNFRIIRNYIIPLSYIIYSFIYIKYQKQQINIQLRLENDLTYDMLSKYFFNYKNPIIKKINVFFYQSLEGKDGKNIKNNNNKIEEDNIISNLTINGNNINQKIITFLGVINDTLPIDDLGKKCNDIFNGLTNLKKNIENIFTNFDSIKTQITTSNPVNSLRLNSIYSQGNIDEILDNISYYKNNTIFADYELLYNQCISQYKNILRDLNKINLNILYFNLRNGKEVNSIIQNNISKSKINEYLEEYNKKKEEINKSNETYKTIEDNNNSIIKYLEDKTELIKEFLKFNNNSNKTILNNYFNEIFESKKKNY